MTKIFLQKASYYILKDIVSIGSRKVNYKSIASSVCQVLPLECAQSLFLNLNLCYISSSYPIGWARINETVTNLLPSCEHSHWAPSVLYTNQYSTSHLVWWKKNKCMKWQYNFSLGQNMILWKGCISFGEESSYAYSWKNELENLSRSWKFKKISTPFYFQNWHLTSTPFLLGWFYIVLTYSFFHSIQNPHFEILLLS